MSLGRVIYDKQNIYLNGNQILGATQFDSNIDFPTRPVSIMGKGYCFQTIDGELTKSFNIGSITSQKDISILSLIGDNPITGVFSYQTRDSDERYWKALNSKLISYSIECSVGSIPNSSFGFEVLNEAGYYETPNTLSTGDLNSIKVVRPGDLVFSGLNFFSSNRLQSINYSVTLPLDKKFFIGSNFNGTGRYNQAFEVSVSLTFDLDDATSGVLSEALCERGFNGLFAFNNCDEEDVRVFGISNAELQSSSLNASVGPNASFSVTYKSYTSDLDNLKSLMISGVPLEIPQTGEYIQ